MKHTKGEWVSKPLNDASNGWIDIKMSDNTTITIYGKPIDKENPNHKIVENLIANAKLIAAAPDLLEALQRFVKFVDKLNLEYESSMVLQAKDAIKKATE